MSEELAYPFDPAPYRSAIENAGFSLVKVVDGRDSSTMNDGDRIMIGFLVLDAEKARVGARWEVGAMPSPDLVARHFLRILDDRRMAI